MLKPGRGRCRGRPTSIRFPLRQRIFPRARDSARWCQPSPTSPRAASSTTTRRSSSRTRVSSSTALHAARSSAFARSRRSAGVSTSSSTRISLIAFCPLRCGLLEGGRASLTMKSRRSPIWPPGQCKNPAPPASRPGAVAWLHSSFARAPGTPVRASGDGPSACASRAHRPKKRATTTDALLHAKSGSGRCAREAGYPGDLACGWFPGRSARWAWSRSCSTPASTTARPPRSSLLAANASRRGRDPLPAGHRR